MTEVKYLSIFKVDGKIIICNDGTIINMQVDHGLKAGNEVLFRINPEGSSDESQLVAFSKSNIPVYYWIKNEHITWGQDTVIGFAEHTIKNSEPKFDVEVGALKPVE